MDERFSKGILVKIGIAILVIALADLFFLNYWVLNSEKLKVESGKQDSSREIDSGPSPLASPSPVPEPSPTVVNETRTVVETPNQGDSKQVLTVIQTAQKEIFIPVGSSSIKKNVWTDVPGLEVTIDTTKYNPIDSIVFEATVWPEGGNGRAYARLINISDNNPLVESEISGASTFGELKISGKIPFPGGSRRYGIQAKSDIDNFSAHVENARIKITLK